MVESQGAVEGSILLSALGFAVTAQPIVDDAVVFCDEEATRSGSSCGVSAAVWCAVRARSSRPMTWRSARPAWVGVPR